MTEKSWIKAVLKEPEKHPFIFLFVLTLLSAVLSNGISGLILDTFCNHLDQITPLNKWGCQLVVVVILTLILIFSIYIANLPAIIQRFLGKRPPYASNVTPMAENVSCRGLIVFMSKTPPEKPSPAESAILHHWKKEPQTIRHCWIICGGMIIRELASQMLSERLSEQQTSIEFFFDDSEYPNPEDLRQPLSLLVPPEKIDDPNYIRQLIEAIYREADEKFNIQEHEIFIDYTGGNKSMTAGAILAGADPDRRLQYIHNDYDARGNIDFDSTMVMEVDISYRVKPIDSRSQ
jgi:CRISPR-associated protein (Cas_Cas02710)